MDNQLLIDTLEKIQEHVATLNDEVGDLCVRVSVLETQVTEILWLQRLLIGAVAIAIVGAVMALILKKVKNNK